MADLIFPAVWQALDGNAKPLAGAKAYFYDTGTTTPRTVYADVAGTVPHPSPLVANASGMFPEVFATGGTAVKVVVQTAAGATVYTQDPVTRTVTASSASSVSFTPTTAIPSSTVQAAVERVQANLDAYIAIDATSGVLQANVLNGHFALWQRATSITAAGYAADRWMMGKSGGTVTFSRQSVAMGELFGPNSPLYHARLEVTGQSAVGDYGVLAQRVEGVRTHNGQTVTVLGYARRVSGAGNIAIDLSQVFGTGGAPSAQVNVTPVQVALSTIWTPFAATFLIPSVSGKTLGSNGDSYLQLAFWASAGSNWNARTGSLGIQTLGVDLWGINIRRGTLPATYAALYVPPSTPANERECFRFYETIDVKAGVTSTSGNTVWMRQNFLVPKRAAPVMAVSATTTNLTGLSYPADTAGAEVRGTVPASNFANFDHTLAADAEFNAAFS